MEITDKQVEILVGILGHYIKTELKDTLGESDVYINGNVITKNYLVKLKYKLNTGEYPPFK